MAPKTQIGVSIGALFAMLLVSCGPSGGFGVASRYTTSSNSSEGSSQFPGSPNSPAAEFNVQDLSGRVSGGPMDKSSVIVYDKSEHAIQVRIPMPGMGFALDMPIPNVPGSRAFVDNSNPLVPVLVVSIPAMYVLGKIGFDAGNIGKDPKVLPNGQLIPFTPGGEPPRISFLIPQINRTVQIYLGINVVAVFVEVSIDPMVDLTFPIRNASKTETIGYFSTVRRRNPSQGGFFVSLNMPREIAGALDDYLRKVIVP